MNTDNGLKDNKKVMAASELIKQKIEEKYSIHKVLNIISKMNLNNKTELKIGLTRVMAVKEMEIKKLKEKLQF